MQDIDRAVNPVHGPEDRVADRVIATEHQRSGAAVEYFADDGSYREEAFAIIRHLVIAGVDEPGIVLEIDTKF
jgi:hypothetical protein